MLLVKRQYNFLQLRRVDFFFKMMAVQLVEIYSEYFVSKCVSKKTPCSTNYIMVPANFFFTFGL